MDKSVAYTGSRNGFGASSCLEDPDTEALQLSEAYVHSLASLGLERLQNEPGRLRSEAMAVDEALHSLSLDHYRVFIQNQECVRHVQAQGQAMEGHLAALLADVHGLGAEFSVFQREAAELVGGHKRNRQTLKHHMQLVELLEVPQLMDACVRSDLIEEALSIATFASTLERRHRSRRAITSSSDGEVEDDEKAAPSGQLQGVIGMIVDEVRQSARGLHERLVAKLKGPIQLTTCLQVVSCLRRLELLALEERNEKKLLQQQQRQQGNAGGAQAQPRGKGVGSGKGVSALGGEGARGSAGDSVGQRQLALVEVKLQVEFLEARDAWLADSANRAGHGDLKLALAGGTPTSPYQSLMDLIETSRSQWFEVATQFRAVFSSVDGTGMGMAMGTGMGGAGRKAKGGRREEGAAGAGRPESGDVLSLWLLRRVSAFVDQLKTLLPLVEDGGLLRSLLEECMFFGASMGRLGTDFRGLLVPVFEERVIGVAVGQWASASADFLVTLRDIAAIEDAGGNGASLLHVPDKISASFGGGSVGRAAGETPHATALSAEGGPPPPPRPLMAFPPVARLVNLVLTSFNQLRECLPSSVEARLADALVQCFADVFQGLADLEKTTVRANAAAAEAAAGEGAQGYAGRREANTTMRAIELACVSLAERAVPHVALCFAVLFGDTPATAIASTVASTAKASNEQQGPRAGKRRGALLLSRMLKSMETFGIYEPPPAPPIKIPAPAQLSMLAPESAEPVAPARPAPGEESSSEGMLSEGATTPAAKGSAPLPKRSSAEAPLEHQFEITESDRVNGGHPESLQD